MLKHYETLLKAYTILEDVTPLKYDCGSLCGSLCCHNNGKDGETLGMWLLPFERNLLEVCDDMEKGCAYTYNVADDGTETVSCNGTCNRKYRPFACRIYPYYAKIGKTASGRIKISIKNDPRARFSCPMAMKNSYLRPSIHFVSRAKAAVRVLLKDEILAKDILEMSDFLSEIEEMQEKLLG